MPRYNAPFEIHVHGDVPLRSDVSFDQIQEALKPLWKYAGARSLADGATSVYEEEPGIRFEQKDGVLNALRDTEDHRALHGLARALVANAVRGLTEGFKKDLAIVGVGYRAELKGKVVVFALGYSHPVEFPVPEGIQIAVEKQTHLSVSGADRAKVGQVAADIRQSNKMTLDELAKKHNLQTGETRALNPTEPVLELGNSKDARAAILNLRQGELSMPISTDRGYVVLSLKEVFPTHQGTLEEVKEKVVAELKTQKSTKMAEDKANELVKRVKAGEKIAGRMIVTDSALESDLPLFFDLLEVPDPERPAPRLGEEARLQRVFEVVRRLERRMRFDLSVTDRHLYLSIGEVTLSGAVQRVRLDE